MKARLKTTLARLMARHLSRVYKMTRQACCRCVQAERDIEEKLCMMFHNETVSNCKPFLPKRWDSLFDNEAGSDVVFLVGTEPDTWRFPGHRSILRNNPVFRAMLEGPFANADSKITIQDVDGRAFDHLLRYLYHEEVQLQSVGTALMTLYAANKYLCPELVDICVRYLDDHITTETVLQIYQHLRFYSNDLSSEVDDDPSGLPSAPPKRDLEDEPLLRNNDNDECGKKMFHSCNSLLFNCYHFIDSHADAVLNEESVEDLTKDALYDLAKRDTLGISSETILFNVVEKWCNRECKRCQVELSNENRKTVLGDRLLFSVRYMLMTSQEFLAGPMHSGLFDQTETAIILGHILDHPVVETSERITPQVLNFLKRSRSQKLCSMIPLSARTKRTVTKYNTKSVVPSKLVLKKEKKKSKEKKDASESKCFNYTLNVLASIFD